MYHRLFVWCIHIYCHIIPSTSYYVFRAYVKNITRMIRRKKVFLNKIKYYHVYKKMCKHF